MSKAIYTLKIYLFRDQFNMKRQELKYIKSVYLFIIRIYVKAWFGYTKANQDLNLINNIIAYPERDIALGLLQKVWYSSMALVRRSSRSFILRS